MTIELTSRLFPIQAYLKYWLVKESLYAVQSPNVFRCYQGLLNHKKAYLPSHTSLDEIRKALLADQSILTIDDFGAGSRHLKKNLRSTADVTRHSTSSKKFSLLYQYFCSLTPAQKVLELGTCTGLNVQYLGAATKEKVYTIEGSEALSCKARSYNSNPRIEYICGKIEEKLPELLEKIEKVDFVLVDASHTESSTLTFFDLMLPFLHEKSILVIGDIHWSAGMNRAWNRIKVHPKITLSMDFYECGVLFFDPAFSKAHYILEY